MKQATNEVSEASYPLSPQLVNTVTPAFLAVQLLSYCLPTGQQTEAYAIGQSSS